MWADQKKYVRQKAAQNLKNKTATGGGPNREQKFSSAEEAIYNLVGMKASVEGVAAKVFGMCREVVATPSTPCELDDLVPCAAEVAEERQAEVEEEILACADVGQKSATVSSLKPSKPIKSPSDALQAELTIQKELLDTIKAAVVNSEQHHQRSKRLFRSVEKMVDLSKSHYKKMEMLKREEIDEMRRHNAYIEQMRAREVEYKLEKNKIHLQLLPPQD